MSGYAELPNQQLRAANGVDYAYRDTGGGRTPLVALQHFRGSLDNWDPALIDALSSSRRVVAFDNVGVGGSSGTTPHRIDQMAIDSIEFVTALELEQIDLLGFSIGSFVAQEIALTRPALLRKVILASSAPKGAAGMHGWAPEVIDAVGKPEPDPDGYLRVFFAESASSRSAGQQALQRIFGPRSDPDQPTTWQTREAQYDAVCDWGIPDHSLLQRVSAIDMPVFVANGDSDSMILPRYSYLLAGLLHAAEFAADVGAFLDEPI